MKQDSQFKLISVGIVAENKLRTTRDVEVSLSEALPFIQGELVSGFTTETVDGVDPSGATQSFKVQLSNTIKAQWKGDGTNRVTAPDVRRGDKVMIYQYGDTDQYFWEVHTGTETNVRRRETVVTAFSNTVDETQTELTPDNAWVQEVNTHDKHITIKTNKSDGEKFAYTAQINAKDGNVVVADDIGNYIQMSSADQTIELETSSGARVEINKKNITLTCDNFTLNAAGEVTIKGRSGNVQIPNTTWKGNLSLTGNMAATGGGGGGSYTFNGNVVTTGGLTNNGKNVGSTHTHNGVQGGPSNTGPVN